MNNLQVYGIPNCNTVKKALDWLREKELPFTFHDFKKEGVTQTKLKVWIKGVTKEVLVNKKGTTWRGLDPEQQASAETQAGAVGLMTEKNSVIKRPVIEWPDGSITVGFDAALFEEKAG
jgi:Spx/MgsR family transcriptional regulator